ncbi:LysR family transcriptional regulator [Phycicoccus sp. CSK15P-2]|nr:LysR family transcriptional regulator [Phycicoccus sp. CSK15P-2]
MIDPRLRSLRVVARCGTITAAAEDLGYTPSALSHQIRTLSRDLGTPLLEPDGRRVRLTAAAGTLLRRADGLIAHWEDIRADVHRTSGHALGRLRLAGFSTAASAMLPSVAVAAVRAFPDSEVRIIEAEPLACFDMLLAEAADVAVVVGTATLPPTDDPRFEQRPLVDDALDLLVPVGHRLAEQERVRLSDAADEPWIMDRPGSAHHHLVSTACAAAGFNPRQAHEVTEWDTGAALVAAGFGVALVPRLARVPGEDETVRVPLRGDPTPSRHVRTSVRAGTSEQPEIALALRELRVVAARVAAAGGVTRR